MKKSTAECHYEEMKATLQSHQATPLVDSSPSSLTRFASRGAEQYARLEGITRELEKGKRLAVKKEKDEKEWIRWQEEKLQEHFHARNSSYRARVEHECYLVNVQAEKANRVVELDNLKMEQLFRHQTNHWVEIQKQQLLRVEARLSEMEDARHRARARAEQTLQEISALEKRCSAITIGRQPFLENPGTLPAAAGAPPFDGAAPAVDAED